MLTCRSGHGLPCALLRSRSQKSFVNVLFFCNNGGFLDTVTLAKCLRKFARVTVGSGTKEKKTNVLLISASFQKHLPEAWEA